MYFSNEKGTFGKYDIEANITYVFSRDESVNISEVIEHFVINNLMIVNKYDPQI